MRASASSQVKAVSDAALMDCITVICASLMVGKQGPGKGGGERGDAWPQLAYARACVTVLTPTTHTTLAPPPCFMHTCPTPLQNGSYYMVQNVFKVGLCPAGVGHGRSWPLLHEPFWHSD